MKRHLLSGLLCICMLSGNAQTFREWQDPEVNAVNRAPMHTHFFAYESTEAATEAVKEKSVNFYMISNIQIFLAWATWQNIVGERFGCPPHRLLEN